MAQSSIRSAAHFRWVIFLDGARWITATAEDHAEARPERFLAPVPSVTESRYPLRDAPALFREFAETPATEEGAKAFADRHGLLGGDILRAITTEDEGVEPRGERLADWAHEIGEMREAVTVWDEIKAGGGTALRERVNWSGDAVKFQTAAGERVLADALAGDPTAALMLPAHDYLRAGRWFVQMIINERMAGRVTPRLAWHDEEGRSKLLVVPTSLIGALWLQFAMVVDEGRDFRRCAHCGKWFDISPDAARRDRIYCSHACRVAAYRARKSGESK